MNDIDLRKFAGMNNVSSTFSNKEGITPKILLNADVDDSGQPKIRAGFTLFLALPGAHSLKGFDSCLLCAANGKLYELSTGTAVELATISGPTDEIDGHIDYVLCEDKIYISNLYWRGVFSTSARTVSSWGIDLPPGPMLISANGNLPAGTYHVCFTTLSGTEISGNGAIGQIVLSEEGGIQILNRPASSLVWVTEKDEPVFYQVGATDIITSIPTSEPLPTFLCGPPPNMTNLMYAFGRLWGSVGSTVYYSEPYRPGLFNLNTNKFDFISDITLLASVPTGIFVGTDEATLFLAGTDPKKMTESRAGAGSVKWTLEYCNNVPYLADILGTSEKVFTDVPIWRTHDGIVAGNISGRLFNLTKDKLRMGKVSKGASLFHQLNGYFTYLTSSSSGDGNIDSETRTIFKNKRLLLNNVAKRGMADRIGMTETFECEVWRDGKQI